MSHYPHEPGVKGGGASREGANAFAPKLGRRQAEAHSALREGPGTSEEIAARIGRHWYVVRPRLSELGAMGLAVKTEHRGVSAFGGPATIWRESTAAERAAFLALKASEAGQ